MTAMDVNEHDESTYIYAKRMRLSVQQYEPGGKDACLLVRATGDGLSCGIDLTAEQALATAAALTRHARALQAAAQVVAEAA